MLFSAGEDVDCMHVDPFRTDWLLTQRSRLRKTRPSSCVAHNPVGIHTLRIIHAMRTRLYRSITIAARNLLYYAHKLDAQRINIKWRAWYNCSTLSTATAADAVQFFEWMAMAGEARRRGWLDWRRQIYDCRICVVIPAAVSLPGSVLLLQTVARASIPSRTLAMVICWKSCITALAWDTAS